jgi:poly(hydroxyalkanoate) depolymerase family esterase
MNNPLQNLMRKAAQLMRLGRMTEASKAIQRLLRSHRQEPNPPAAPGDSVHQLPVAQNDRVDEKDVVTDRTVDSVELSGKFISGTHTNATLTRRYKLYIPPDHTAKMRPLVVMLHGCTQNPDDFAAGTGMNQRAQTQGFYVLYPEQPTDANPSACWNWFKPNHQKRGSGESALIASLTQTIIRQYGVESQRVYVAGLSAGGAMAAVLAAAYPDIYAAVGVHSGLPAGAASNVAQALMVMKSGYSTFTLPGLHQREDTSNDADLKPIPIPTIVFHGDQDKTVHPHNGDKLIATVQGQTRDSVQIEHGTAPHGRSYTRSTRYSEQGIPLSEHWLVHGAGHAWSGGLPAGSYSDPQGPDATGEMLRFFFSQKRKT